GKMRIRKNMKLSSMLLATAGYGGDKLETYVCPLNQSPWDVIPLTSSLDDDNDDGAAELTNLIDSSWFLPSPSSSSPSLTHQFAGEDNFNGNVSLGDSNGAAQRLNGSAGNNHSLVSDERLDLIAPESSPGVEDPSDDSDKKSYSVQPHSPVKTSGDDYQAAVSVPAPPKRGRPRGSGKKAQASSTAASNNNPYEFYYYSGFGPRWGRKRGGSGDDEKIVLTDDKNGCEDNMSFKKSNSSGEESSKTAAFEHGSSSFDGFEFMEEDYDVVDQSTGHGKKMTMAMKKMKRGRKPVKERSLKSLM
ncbi:hypothetical protein HID58_084011, partial [Brassica napus]